MASSNSELENVKRENEKLMEIVLKKNGYEVLREIRKNILLNISFIILLSA